MIYGISGKKQSGKNTVAKIWQLLDYYYNIYDRRNINIKNNDVNYVVDRLNNNDYVDLSNWQQKAYADKLKEIACLLLGCTREQLEDNDFKESQLDDHWKVYTGNIPSTTGRYDDRKLFTSVDSLYDYYQGLGYKPETITVNVKTLTPRLLLQLLGTQCGREIIHPEIWINALFADYKVISNINQTNVFDDNRLKHGFNDSRIYYIYHNMKQRCNNPKHPRYDFYGNKGITVCDEWNSFEYFLEWSKNSGYRDFLTLDRIDNSKGYEPSNCRWTTYSIQNINQELRKDNTSGYKGVSKDKHGWRADIQINKKREFLGYFETAEQASEAYELRYIQREELYLKEQSLIYPSWLITDVRFPNEVDAIKQRNGKVIRVNRINYKQYVEYEGKMVEAFDVHPSETSLDNYDGFDYVIEATGTAADLIPKVKAIMIKEGIINGTD